MIAIFASTIIVKTDEILIKGSNFPGIYVVYILFYKITRHVVVFVTFSSLFSLANSVSDTVLI